MSQWQAQQGGGAGPDFNSLRKGCKLTPSQSAVEFHAPPSRGVAPAHGSHRGAKRFLPPFTNLSNSH